MKNNIVQTQIRQMDNQLISKHMQQQKQNNSHKTNINLITNEQTFSKNNKIQNIYDQKSSMNTMNYMTSKCNILHYQLQQIKQQYEQFKNWILKQLQKQQQIVSTLAKQIIKLINNTMTTTINNLCHNQHDLKNIDKRLQQLNLSEYGLKRPNIKFENPQKQSSKITLNKKYHIDQRVHSSNKLLSTKKHQNHIKHYSSNKYQSSQNFIQTMQKIHNQISKLQYITSTTIIKKYKKQQNKIIERKNKYALMEYNI